MRRQQASQAHNSIGGASARSKSAEHPIRTLQRRAGNRTVTSLIDFALQREATLGQPGAKAASEESASNPALVAMFEASVLDPLRRAVPLIRGWKKTKAREELYTSTDTLRKLAKVYEKSDPLLFETLRGDHNQIQMVGHSLKPRPLGHLADYLEGSIASLEGRKLH